MEKKEYRAGGKNQYKGGKWYTSEWIEGQPLVVGPHGV